MAAPHPPRDVSTGDLFAHFGVGTEVAPGSAEERRLGEPRPATPCASCGWFVDGALCPICGAAARPEAGTRESP